MDIGPSDFNISEARGIRFVMGGWLNIFLPGRGPPRPSFRPKDSYSNTLFVRIMDNYIKGD